MTSDDPAGRPAAPAGYAGPIPRRPWTAGLAPEYIGLFLLIAYFDPLAPSTLAVGGLGPSLLGAVVAGALGFALLYYAPAAWGVRSGRGTAGVAARTFGRAAAPWLPGVLLGLGHVVWLAVAVDLGADVALRGLVTLGLAPARILEPQRLGGLTLRGPVVLFVTLNWVVPSVTLGIWVTRLVSATMRAFAVFPAMALAGAMLWALPGVGRFRVPGVPPGSVPSPTAGLAAFTMMIQLVCGYFAAFGTAAADWGAASRDLRDVRRGGLVGVALAPVVIAALALLTVAGAFGRAAPPPGRAAVAPPRAPILEPLLPPHLRGRPEAPKVQMATISLRHAEYSYREAIQHRMGGLPGGLVLMLFGLPLLGPACFSPFVFGTKFAEALPALPRWAWSLVGGLVAWPLVALRVAEHLDLVFGLMGAAFAPVAGAMAADAVRSWGAWPGPRRGVNLPGVVAWAAGVAAGLVPYAGPMLGLARAWAVQPAAVLAFLVAFVVYGMLGLVGLESATEADEPAGGG